MILLDTNTCIALLRGSSPTVRMKLEEQDAAEVYICSIVRAELLFGARRSAKVSHNLQITHDFLAHFSSISFDDRAAELYAQIRARLVGSGQQIGANDMLIAAISLAHNAILVTNNVREFMRIQDLVVEDWLNK